MGLLQQMEEECDCTEVIFQDYIQSRGTRRVFLFFEGKDDYKFYWSRLSPFIGTEKYKKYNCNCKDNVVTVHEMITTRTQKRGEERLLYFVDKDFDKENDLSDEIYVTPVYAIENFYITDSAIENMLIGEWGLSSEMEEIDRKDVETAINYLVTKRTEMIESILYANAGYSLQYNKTKYNPPFPKLSAIKEYKCIENVEDKVVLQSMVPCSVDVTDDEIAAEINYLKEKPIERLRGKYFEQVMPKYIMKVFEDSNKKNDRKMFAKRRRVTINVGTENMVSILSNYADVPNDLITYIRRKFQPTCAM